MNNHHDLTWRHGRIFTERKPVPWKLLLIGYVVVCFAAFMAGVWSA